MTGFWQSAKEKTMIRLHSTMATLLLTATLTFGAGAAQAGSCAKYGAKATSNSVKNAKWFVMETIVQQVSWGMWPGWVANGKTPGYTVRGKRYRCKKTSGGFTCIGQATFCKKQ